MLKIFKKFFIFCVFHKEKTPSLLINKDYFYCFGCKRYGKLNEFNYYKKLSNKILIKNSNKNIKFFNNVFIKNKKFLIFLKNRKIKKKIIKKFKLDIYNNKNYIIFKNRLIIPIFINKVLVAYSARTILNERPKYINSYNNKKFIRNENFYGYWITIKYIKRLNKVILVEGYFDLIMLYQNNIKNVLSLMGNNLNFLRINKIYNITKNIFICFDGDNSGINSIKNIILNLNKFKFTINKYILIPFKLDVDLFIRKFKKKNFLKKIKKSKNIFFVFFYLFMKDKKNYFKTFNIIKNSFFFIFLKYLNIKTNYKLKFFLFLFYEKFYKKNFLVKKNFNFKILIQKKILGYFLLFPFIIYKIKKIYLIKIFKKFLFKIEFLNIFKFINSKKKKNFIIFKDIIKYYINFIFLFKNIKLQYIFNFKLNKFLKYKKKYFTNFIEFFIKNSIKYLIYINFNYEKF